MLQDTADTLLMSPNYFDINMKNILRTVLLTLSLMTNTALWAQTFTITPETEAVGQILEVTTENYDSLAEIGRRYGVGAKEMMQANPTLDPWAPKPGSTVIVPAEFLLPKGSRQGIVINLAEMRLYFYHPDGKHISTYPVGIGQEGWSTPVTETTIVKKRKNPAWYVPDSIWEQHAKRGEYLPHVVPPGPKNPLGNYALNLALGGYLIHGTIPNKAGVGLRSSHGCIRMLPNDIEELFNKVEVGTKVRIIHDPIKLGRHSDKLLLEAHKPLTEAIYRGSDSIEALISDIAGKTSGGRRYHIDWAVVEKALKHPNGVPQVIGH